MFVILVLVRKILPPMPTDVVSVMTHMMWSGLAGQGVSKRGGGHC